MSDRPLDPTVQPSDNAGLQACFVSGHSHGFVFEPVLRGWARYVAEISTTIDGPLEADAPRLAFIGAPPSDDGAIALAEADPTVELVGRVPADEVATRLNSVDIGLYPSRQSWAYSLGNKVFDYLSSGLYLLHSIEPGVSADIDRAGVGHRVEANGDGWYRAFTDLHARRQQLRAERPERIDAARAHYGPAATTERLCEIIERIDRI